MSTDPRPKSSGDDDARKKRVGKACDSCRMKKTKCDGRKPCSKCTLDNKLCTYSEKKKLVEKTYTSAYVELLECRIQILQNSVVKLVSKISKDEDVSQYVPRDGEFSINNVIDLLMADEIDAEDDEAYQKLRAHHESVVSSASPSSALSSAAPSFEQGSSSYSQSEDDASSSPETSESPQTISLHHSAGDDYDDDALDKLDDLSLGPYKSAAAMAAAAAASMSGGYAMPLPESPISMDSPDMDAATNGWPFSSTGISPAALDSTHSPSSPIQRQSSWTSLSKVHKSPRVQHRHTIDTHDISDFSINAPPSQQQQQQQVRRSRSIGASAGLRRHKRSNSSNLHHTNNAVLNFDNSSLLNAVTPQQMLVTPVITAAPQQLMTGPAGMPTLGFNDDSIMADDMWWNAKPMAAATTGPLFDTSF